MSDRKWATGTEVKKAIFEDFGVRVKSVSRVKNKREGINCLYIEYEPEKLDIDRDWIEHHLVDTGMARTTSEVVWIDAINRAYV